jgi:hypothetical protein
MTCIVGVIDQGREPFGFGFGQSFGMGQIDGIGEFLKSGGFARYEEGSERGVISWSASGIGSSTSLQRVGI